jgi:peptidoglycan/LPS O-acetylase OafA/YrhL
MVEPAHKHHCSYRPDVDGLRAVAVLAVIGFHAFPGFVRGGYVGVDVFFVISGYLISGIILRGLWTRQFSFWGFYARRVRRIVPALAVVLMSTTIIGWLLLLPDEYAQLEKHVISAAFFVSNFTLWSEAGYFDTASVFKPLLHLWSLAVEEQFYLLWPMALVLGWKLATRIPLCIIAIASLSFALMIYLSRADPPAAFYSPLCRWWELMLGAGIASFPQLTIKNPFQRDLLSSLGTLSILLAAAVPLDHIVTAAAMVVPTAGAGMIIAAGPLALLNRNLLSWRPAVWIGLISYPLYLWHWPLLSFAKIIDPTPPPIRGVFVKIVLITIAFALAFTTYRFLEVKIRSSPMPRYAKPLLGSLGIACGTALIGAMPAVRVNSVPGDPFAWEETRWRTRSCLERYHLVAALEPFCIDFNPQVSPSMIVLGDSHSNHLMPGLEKAFPKTGILNIGSGACLPFENVDGYSQLDDAAHRQLCRVTMGTAFDVLRTNKSISTVLLSARGTSYISDHPFQDGEGYRLRSHVDDDDSNITVFVTALRRTLQELSDLDKRTIIVFDVPILGFHPKECLHLRTIELFNVIRKPCAVPRNVAMAEQHLYREMVMSEVNKFSKVSIVDPFDVLCDETFCAAIKDGQVFYRDADHLSVFGSEYVIDRLAIGYPCSTMHAGPPSLAEGVLATAPALLVECRQ